MKLVWSPETASDAYIDTVKSCKKFKESGVSELLSAMAAGWDAKLIVESWTNGDPIATSIGLTIAARHTNGRHVCVVPDERSRAAYVSVMREAGMQKTMDHVTVGEAEEVMPSLIGVDFMVVDSKRRGFVKLLRMANLSSKGAVLACKNAMERDVVSGFKWHRVFGRETRVVRSVFLPVGMGLDIAHIGSKGGGAGLNKGPHRWIKHIDRESGEEHLFRG